MKYVYAVFTVIALFAGLALLLWQGATLQTMLILIFGATCAVAAEIVELRERLARPARDQSRDAGKLGPSGERIV